MASIEKTLQIAARAHEGQVRSHSFLTGQITEEQYRSAVKEHKG